MSEHELMDACRIWLSENGFTAFRVNVGTVRMNDGRFFRTGLPKGFSDIFAVRKSDGRACFVETKVRPGSFLGSGNFRRPSKEQIHFLDNMKNHGCIAGVVYSLDDLEGLIRR
jgi:hypothetical protein